MRGKHKVNISTDSSPGQTNLAKHLAVLPSGRCVGSVIETKRDLLISNIQKLIRFFNMRKTNPNNNCIALISCGDTRSIFLLRAEIPDSNIRDGFRQVCVLFKSLFVFVTSADESAES